MCQYIFHITFYKPNILSCLLNCITETTQVTEGRKYFPRGSQAACLPHVNRSYSPYLRAVSFFISDIARRFLLQRISLVSSLWPLSDTGRFAKYPDTFRFVFLNSSRKISRWQQSATPPAPTSFSFHYSLSSSHPTTRSNRTTASLDKTQTHQQTCHQMTGMSVINVLVRIQKEMVQDFPKGHNPSNKYRRPILSTSILSNELAYGHILNQKLATINPLNTKRRPLYLKTHFVPRSKNFSYRLQKPISLRCKWHKSLFVLR